MAKVISLPKRRRKPTAAKRRESAKQRKFREALDELGELWDPGGFVRREMEGDANLQALQRGRRNIFLLKNRCNFLKRCLNPAHPEFLQGPE